MKETIEEKIDELLTRGVEHIYPSRDKLKSALLSGKKISLYTGVDPTAPTLHIGHGVFLRKMRGFQDLGHRVIFLMGDFTGLMGDPTGRGDTRKQLKRGELLKNCKNYVRQAGKILDFKNKKNPPQVLYNSKWLSKLTLEDVISLASHFTVQQMLERDMFQSRMREGRPVHIHEFLYPLMQGYDSVAMNVDMEVGGNDQTFNMLTGRTLMKILKNKEKFVLATKLLADPTGRKMGKTEGNMITFDDKANEMYGKGMSWGDGMIFSGLEVLTDMPTQEIEGLKNKTISGSLNPRDAKMVLAKEVVKIYHGDEEALGAEEFFIKAFQKKEVPAEMEEVYVKKGSAIGDILIEQKKVNSKSGLARLIKEGSIDIDGKKVKEANYPIEKDSALRVGKKKFLRLKIK